VLLVVLVVAVEQMSSTMVELELLTKVLQVVALQAPCGVLAVAVVLVTQLEALL
jgi:hypothetical protein